MDVHNSTVDLEGAECEERSSSIFQGLFQATHQKTYPVWNWKP